MVKFGHDALLVFFILVTNQIKEETLDMQLTQPMIATIVTLKG